MNEEWRPVLGREGIYEVSNFGRLRNWMRSGRRSRTISEPRYVTGHTTKQGYTIVHVHGRGNKSSFIHVLVCEAFHGPRPDGMEALHIDRNKVNNRADNLRWGPHYSPGCPRTDFFDEHFFNVIDTEAKAYWLGMLTADGWVELRNHCTGLSLKDEDREHVVRFLRDVGSAKNPSRKPRREGRLSWTAQLYSKIMFQSLLKYGVVPSKSLIAIPADHLLPSELQRHYWRGLVDGDGTVRCWDGISTSGRGEVRLCGTHAICSGFITFIRSCGINGGSLFQHKNHVNPFWVVCFHGSGLSQDVAHLLYDRTTVALPRKSEQARRIMEATCRHRFRLWPTRQELDAMFERLGSWSLVAAEIGTSTGSLWRKRKEFGYPVGTYQETRGRPATPHEAGLVAP